MLGARCRWCVPGVGPWKPCLAAPLPLHDVSTPSLPGPSLVPDVVFTHGTVFTNDGDQLGLPEGGRTRHSTGSGVLGLGTTSGRCC